MENERELYWIFKCKKCCKVHFKIKYLFECEKCGSEELDSETTDEPNLFIDDLLKKRKEYVNKIMNNKEKSNYDIS